MRRALVCIAALGGLAGCGGDDNKGATSPAAPKGRTQTTKVEVVTAKGRATPSGFDPQTIYKTEGPGVVTLVSLAGRGNGEALGSGFVVDGQGYIATNAHVVTSDSGAKAKQVYVQFADGN